MKFSLVRMRFFVKIKQIVNLRKSCFFENQTPSACATVQKYFTPQLSIKQFKTLAYCFSGFGTGNCAILFKRLLHKNHAAPKFISWYQTI